VKFFYWKLFQNFFVKFFSLIKSFYCLDCKSRSCSIKWRFVSMCVRRPPVLFELRWQIILPPCFLCSSIFLHWLFPFLKGKFNRRRIFGCLPVRRSIQKTPHARPTGGGALGKQDVVYMTDIKVALTESQDLIL